MALDGAASTFFTNVASLTLNLTTVNSNDIIVAVTAGQQPLTGVSGGGLTFSPRASVNFAANGYWAVSYQAVAASPLNNVTFTLNLGGAGSGTGILLFGISGADINTIFDLNSSLPVQSTVDPASYSTNYPYNFVMAILSDGFANVNTPLGFVDIAPHPGYFCNWCYKIVSAVQTNQTVDFGVDANAAVVLDAVRLSPITLMGQGCW